MPITELIIALVLAQSTCDGTWTQATPEGHGSVAIGYDPVRQRIVTAADDAIREYDGATWTVRTTFQGGAAQSMCYDPARQMMYIFGPWGYDDKLWTYHCPTATLTLVSDNVIGGRDYAAIAFDTTRDRLVVHGGYNGNSLLADTWEWNPGTNTWQSFGNGPIGRRYAHRMVYDKARGKSVLHGGFYFFNRNDTWTWNGATWTQLPSTGPGRYVFNMLYDARRGRTVLHGGTTCCGEVEYGSTWVLEGDSWIECGVGGPPRGYANWAHDEARDVYVLAGGIGPTPSGRQWIPATQEYTPPSLCIADVTDDGLVNSADLGLLLASWGSTDPAFDRFDLDGDGTIGQADLGVLLAQWGSCPN